MADYLVALDAALCSSAYIIKAAVNQQQTQHMHMLCHAQAFVLYLANVEGGNSCLLL